MRRDIEDLIAHATGSRPLDSSPMSGGSVGEVMRVGLENGQTVVAKIGGAGSGLALEGYMLRYLGEHSRLPVPAVLHAEERLLLMSHVEADGGLTAAAQADAADLLADLHAITEKSFGFGKDTLIGGLDQPNPRTTSWLAFFRDQRLLYMGREALRAGRLPGRLMGRLETLAGRLPRWLDDGSPPSLVHGDMWTGNVLCKGGRIAAFIDPAVYYADAEIELAFSTLFGTFGEAFFDRYREHRPLQPGFFEVRRDLYNLYPLLVHVRLFGGSYVGSVERTLRQFGC
ncbi:MAG: fructosamine kinase family protein [Rhodospirillales bacterium]|nr:fructosamine kinase family protein [Rhodospirillales bacterium]MDP7099265.1 fructosamine kinase family protein [Rhodospirillales bacterium]MDP7215387.1 fructosamine kinase family protein [Rhodospirillales bacterium]HJP55343.1 fructosamine kinase family protein [Rhodospirillales bacterium]